MRRSEQYTVPSELYSLPARDAYREVFRDLPWLQRVYLLIRTWFGSADIVTVVKEHELEEVRKRVQAADEQLADVSIPALMSGFHARARAVALAYRSMKRVLSEARGTGAGAFMILALEKLAPDLHHSVEAAAKVPEETVTDLTVTVGQARESVMNHLHEALEIHRSAITSRLDPVWKSLESLAALGTVDFKGLIPETDNESIRTPMRIVRDQLTRLACVIELCERNRHDTAARIAAEYAAGRIGRQEGSHAALWSAIDELSASVPLVDLVRLAMDEPRLSLAQIEVKSSWWARFTTAWHDTIRIGPTLLRRRALMVEQHLTDYFAVQEGVPSWIPASLLQRSIGALRRLVETPRYHETSTMVGALAREHELIPRPERARILEAHVELDKALSRLEELLGRGNERGAIGEELRRISQAGGEGGITGMHKINMYAKYRPDLRVLLDTALTAMATISESLGRYRSQIRKALKARTVRVDVNEDDLPPEEYLDLIVSGYRDLALRVRSLVAIEQELVSGSGEQRGESSADTEADAEPSASVASSAEHREQNAGSDS